MRVFFIHVWGNGARVSFFWCHLTSDCTLKPATNVHTIVGMMMITLSCDKIWINKLFQILLFFWREGFQLTYGVWTASVRLQFIVENALFIIFPVTPKLPLYLNFYANMCMRIDLLLWFVANLATLLKFCLHLYCVGLLSVHTIFWGIGSNFICHSYWIMMCNAIIKNPLWNIWSFPPFWDCITEEYPFFCNCFVIFLFLNITYFPHSFKLYFAPIISHKNTDHCMIVHWWIILLGGHKVKIFTKISAYNAMKATVSRCMINLLHKIHPFILCLMFVYSIVNCKINFFITPFTGNLHWPSSSWIFALPVCLLILCLSACTHSKTSLSIFYSPKMLHADIPRFSQFLNQYTRSWHNSV